MKSIQNVIIVLLFATASLSLTACAGGMSDRLVDFINYPGFWTKADDYNYITVAPVTNDQYPEQYVSFASNEIMESLQSNNHYVIYDYSNGIDYNSLNEKEGELVAYTTINSYSVERGKERNTRTEQRKRVNSETGEEYYVDVEIPYDYHWQESYANVTLTLYSSRVDGGVLKSFTRDGTCSDSDSTPPRHHPNLYSAESMERCAIGAALRKVVYQIIPTRESKYLTPDDTLMVFQTVENEWEKVSKVKEKYGEDFRIYLKLPGMAYMNDFVLEVVTNDKEKSLVKYWNVHWDGQYARLYYDVNMYDLYTISRGSTKFILRLKSSLENAIVIENEFKMSFEDEKAAKARLESESVLTVD